MDLVNIIFFASNGYAPVVTATSGGGSVNYGSSFTVGVTATGTAPLSYQWKKDGVSVSGATSSSLTTSISSGPSTAVFTCVVSNAFGSTTSSGITINLTSPGVAPYGVNVYGGGTFPVGEFVNLSVSASGDTPFTYSWSSGSTASSTSVVSEVAASITVSCTVTNAYGSASSSALVVWA